ncbi:hypothetical protein EW145_g1398 [Phellinidium pouzarii]|uniref:Pre-rRNA-processing protein IPI3 n=1 Tax=Phellinidium pouzarii TaxID=167371 RepID=A0A4S4LK90_9AGAM|nr:hypothetical protein EW145_g1398 [Phellinidium pouzarii]
MRYQETVLCSTGASSSSQGLGAVTLHDFHTGSLLASFKQTCADIHSTSVLQTKNGQGGFILAAQPDKSIMNAYYFQKIASGILFNVWDAHYRKVTVLRFTQDGAALISGSEDSGVSVWFVSSLLANEAQHETPTPYCTLSDHTLSITDIVCGTGTFPSCRILTSSVDHSVKLWDLSSRTLLTTFLFPSPIHSLAFEIAERTFFAASSAANSTGHGGAVYQVKLFRRRNAQSSRPSVEALGGGGISEAIRLDADPKGMIFVGQPISSLALSITQSMLLIGTAVGEVHLYDIASHQLLRTLSPVKDKAQGLAVTHIECMLKPPDLIGHINLDLQFGGMMSAKDAMPTKPVTPFQRVRDGKARDMHSVPMMLPTQNEPFHDPTLYTTLELLREHALFVQSSVPQPNLSVFSDTPQSSLAGQQTRLSDLEAEVQHLRAQLAKAKSINDTMWETVVQRVVTEKRAATGIAVKGFP